MIGERLGVSQQTLSRWAGRRWSRQGRRLQASGALVPVAITPAKAGVAITGTSGSQMIVAGPAHMRVAGLTLEELVQLWRGLAC